MIWNKVHKRCKNFSKKIYSQSSQGEVQSSLKDPLTCFGQPTKNFPLDVQKKQFVSFAKNSHLKVSFKTENPVLTTKRLFLRELVKKISVCPKKKKKLEIKLFFVKILLWTRILQFQHPRRKTRHEAENFLLNVWKWWKVSFVFQKSIFPKCFSRYDECSFDRQAKLFLINYRNWSEKSQQKIPNFFEIFFFKMFQWRGRKQLESPADFLPTVSRNFSARFSNESNKL